jgi:hypothetical protein
MLKGAKMAQQISEGRKVLYYIGMLLMVIGGILFLSAAVTMVMHFGDFSNQMDAIARSSALRSFGGFGLLIVGAIIRGIGAAGLAGSGVVLDPKKAREELEPFSRQAGGMVKDALDEADINLGGRAEKVIMIKCPSCGKLNEEDSKFCQECGKKI